MRTASGGGHESREGDRQPGKRRRRDFGEDCEMGERLVDEVSREGEDGLQG